MSVEDARQQGQPFVKGPHGSRSGPQRSEDRTGEYGGEALALDKWMALRYALRNAGEWHPSVFKLPPRYTAPLTHA